MKKIFLLFSLSIFVTLSSLAQIAGKITDPATFTPVKNAAVALLQSKDSVLVGHTRTSADGSFSFRTPINGNYFILVMHPSFADYSEELVVNGSAVIISNIAMLSKSKLLEAVVVNAVKSIRVKGDTTSYTADSFKVGANANVEELLKKLPGLQVDKDGKITAQGKEVQTVLVDGEPFFGDDPGMAIKNLRADAVKEVQVFDKKSEQADFTGIDDGEVNKTINLKLKEEAKKGYFGKVDLSGGPLKNIEDRYNNNILINSFKGKRKVAAFLLNGNTNQDGLSWQDSDKFGLNNESMEMSEDGGVMFYSSGRTSDEEPYVDVNNGFTKNLNAGLQYSNKWENKNSINFSPQYNEQRYNNTVKSFNRIQTGADSVLNTRSNNNDFVNRNSIKLATKAEIKIDSATSLTITAGANFYNTETSGNSESNVTGEKGDLKNERTSRYVTTNDKQAYNTVVTLKHSFKKPKRTFSLTGNLSYITSKGDLIQQSENKDYIFATQLDINQDFIKDKNSLNLGAKAVYTEPLSKKYAILLSHEVSVTNGKNNQTAYSFNPMTGKYDIFVDSLTNNFDQNISTQKPGAILNFKDKKINWTLGSSFGFTNFDFTDVTRNKLYNRDFTNIFPAATFTYKYKSNSSISLRYNGNTTQPTLNQIQPLRDNSNQFNLYIGNPDLKQSFSNNISINQNAYNFIKDRYVYQGISFNNTLNQIVNNTDFNQLNGSTKSRPTNTNGGYSAFYYGGGGLKLKKINTQLNFNGSLSLSKQPVILNNVKDFSNNFSSRLGIGFDKSKDKKYEIDIRQTLSYNTNKYGPTNNSTNFYTLSLEQNIKLFLTKTTSLKLENEYNFRQNAVRTNPNQSFNILNATIEKTFKKDVFTLYVKGRDLFNQNTGIQQFTSGNGYYETINTRLQRYFLLGVRWDFKNKGAMKKAAE